MFEYIEDQVIEEFLAFCKKNDLTPEYDILKCNTMRPTKLNLHEVCSGGRRKISFSQGNGIFSNIISERVSVLQRYQPSYGMASSERAFTGFTLKIMPDIYVPNNIHDDYPGLMPHVRKGAEIPDTIMDKFTEKIPINTWHAIQIIKALKQLSTMIKTSESDLIKFRDSEQFRSDVKKHRQMLTLVDPKVLFNSMNGHIEHKTLIEILSDNQFITEDIVAANKNSEYWNFFGIVFSPYINPELLLSMTTTQRHDIFYNPNVFPWERVINRTKREYMMLLLKKGTLSCDVAKNIMGYIISDEDFDFQWTTIKK